MQDLFRTLPKLMKELDGSEEVREAVIFAAWRKAAGQSIYENTAPQSLNGKHLIISVRDKMWKRHLEKDLVGQMLFKINSILGSAEVTFIEFLIDEARVLKQKHASRKKDISNEELEEIALNEVSPKLRRHADSIKDDNLRYQFLLAAGGYLARRKRDNK